MATFKKTKKLMVEAEPAEPIIQDVNVESETETVTEIKQEPVKSTQKPAMLKHQFDESGLQYEGRKFPLKSLLASILMLAIVAGVLFITLTSTGRDFLQSITNPAVSSSGVVETNSTTSAATATEGSLELPAQRDFSESSEEEIRTQLGEDANLVQEQLVPDVMFSTPDWEFELGL